MEYVLVESWRRSINQYREGITIFKLEKDLEVNFTNNCKMVMRENDLNYEIGNQRQSYGKTVDVWIGSSVDPAVVELKIYHDTADWKETKTSQNTVETDLKFAKGKENTWVGIIDTIPTTTRQQIPYNLKWKSFSLSEDLVRKYNQAKGQSVLPREAVQREIFAKGTEV